MARLETRLQQELKWLELRACRSLKELPEFRSTMPNLKLREVLIRYLALHQAKLIRLDSVLARTIDVVSAPHRLRDLAQRAKSNLELAYWSYFRSQELSLRTRRNRMVQAASRPKSLAYRRSYQQRSEMRLETQSLVMRLHQGWVYWSLRIQICQPTWLGCWSKRWLHDFVLRRSGSD